MTDSRCAESMTLADGTKVSVNDRIIWRDMFGIAGSVVAARVVAVMVHHIGFPSSAFPSAAMISIEPGGAMLLIARWIGKTEPYANLPKAATGLGGMHVVSGDEIWMASVRGNLRLATGTEEEKTSLTKMPDWWATRHEDLARQKAEEGNANAMVTESSGDTPVAGPDVPCGVIDCASPIGSDAVTVNMPNGTTLPICRYCAEERITWPRWKPYQNNTPIVRPCPHCRTRIGAGARCECTVRPGDPEYKFPSQLFAGERDLIRKLDNYIRERFPNQVRSGEHVCDTAIRILRDLAKRL